MNEQFDNYSFLIKQAPASIYKDRLVFIVNSSTFGQGFTYPFKPSGFYYSDGSKWIYKGATNNTGGTGTVTSVDITTNAPAITITGNPITTAGTIDLNFNGAISDYIDGTGALQVFPTIPVVTPAALTATNDSNVTLTLGGTPSTALLQAASLTLGWSGQLSIARGGTGLGTLGTANQLLRVNAGATALEYFTPTYLTGLTVGTTPIASGTAGCILFEGAGNVLQESSNLFWDNTNGRLNINAVSSPTGRLSIKSPTSTSLAIQVRNNADTLNNLAFNGNSQLLIQNSVSALTISHRTDVTGFSITTGTSGYGTGDGIEVVSNSTYIVNSSVRGLRFRNDSDSPDLYTLYSQGAGNGKRLAVQVNGTERFSFNPNGNFLVGFLGANTAVGTITIGNQTAPTGNTTNAIQIYSQNQTNASFHVRDSNSRVFYAGEKTGMRSNHNLQLAANDTVYVIVRTTGALGVANLAADPAGNNGDIYYNTTTNKFRAFENGAWANLI